MKMKFFSFSV